MQVFYCVTVIVLYVCSDTGFVICKKKDLLGHEKPLGSHMSPLGITVIGKFSTPGVFYEHFVKVGMPILMKQPLINSKYPPFSKWNDNYLSENYGGVSVSVETSKKEKRNKKPTSMILDDFLDIYKHQDVYMVQRVNKEMMDDVHVPITLQCGGFQNVINDAVIWFSGGSTRSVLHYDVLDNLLCLLDGKKEVLLINKTYSYLVEADGFNKDGMYSKVDVDSVNMKQFPHLQKVPWFQARMQAGDCLYIPNRWYHQISSAPGRNLAINFWFSHLWWFDHEDCERKAPMNLSAPLSNFGLASSNEQVRSAFLEFFEEYILVSRSQFLNKIPAEEKKLEELFAIIDKDKNSILTWKEMYDFNIDDVVRQFPDVFQNSILEKSKQKEEQDSEKMAESETTLDDETTLETPSSNMTNDKSKTDDSKLEMNDTEREKDDSRSKMNDSKQEPNDFKREMDNSRREEVDSKTDSKLDHSETEPENSEIKMDDSESKTDQLKDADDDIVQIDLTKSIEDSINKVLVEEHLQEKKSEEDSSYKETHKKENAEDKNGGHDEL